MEPFYAVCLPWKKSSPIGLVLPNKGEILHGPVKVFWCLIIIITILLVAVLRQTGIEAEENRAHPQREDRFFFNQRHGKQEKITGQQPIGSNPKGPWPTENCWRQKTRRRKRWDRWFMIWFIIPLSEQSVVILSLCFVTAWSPINSMWLCITL